MDHGPIASGYPQTPRRICHFCDFQSRGAHECSRRSGSPSNLSLALVQEIESQNDDFEFRENHQNRVSKAPGALSDRRSCHGSIPQSSRNSFIWDDRE
ncbi:hypothetical protein L5515_006109 [Caenorhabditis briggsae]|uniref:Uncharacterized protein n=1 Tax=Caenorhabditis briggsae TaxID=6238 RepID=A0AAE9JJ39_CAEBR|nr:hypothetical protein L5515_006109 [Caenorhabditis briggsae]